MSLWSSSSSGQPPRDSADLAFLMSFVTGVGGVSAWQMMRSTSGLLSGVGVAGLFFVGGMKIMGTSFFENPSSVTVTKAASSHEIGHQMCLFGSLMFTGAMSYRAGSNPYAGPGGAMLAALGAVSGLYHLDKMIEWRKWEEARVAEAERLLRQHQAIGDSGEVRPGGPPGGMLR